MVKGDVSKSIGDGKPKFYLEIKECKMFCAKLNAWPIVAQESANILIFFTFKYGAEYGAECSAESGAKLYFIVGKIGRNWMCFASFTKIIRDEWLS